MPRYSNQGIISVRFLVDVLIGFLATLLLVLVVWNHALAPTFKQKLTSALGLDGLFGPPAADVRPPEPQPDGRLVTPVERAEDELAVVFFDVGQGDSFFIQTPGNHNLLVDTGEGDYDLYGRDIDRIAAAQRVILPFMEKNGIEHLDYFITTHPHQDHIGAASDVIYESNVRQVIRSGKDHTTTGYEMFIESIEETGVPVELPVGAGGALEEGEQIPLGLTELQFKRFAPNDDDINNASITFSLEYGGVNMILTGDTEEPGEKELVEKWGDKLDATVLKAGHHGSTSSSTEEFVEAVSPDHTIIQVGGYNDYGHPSSRIISRFKEHGSEIHRNDEDGTISVLTDGNNVRVDTSSEFSAVR